jgi:hypothetical protein
LVFESFELMKVLAVILGWLGGVALLVGIWLLRDYAAYDVPIEGTVVQVSGREPLIQLPETNAQGRPWQLKYGNITGRGIHDMPTDQPLYKVGDKIQLLHRPGDPEKSRLPESLSAAPAIWCMVIGLLLVAAAAGVFMLALKASKQKAAKAPAKPKRSGPQRIGI